MELSVRFFKRMILLVLALMILVPTGLAVGFGVSHIRLTAEVERLEGQLARVREALNETMEQAARLEEQRSAKDEPTVAEPLGYQALYPELCCTAPKPAQRERISGNVYLTFDDGPSANTSSILDTLAQHGVKATFFVTGEVEGEASAALMRRIVDEGHTIGIHTYSHDYGEVYRSVANYLTDFKRIYDLVYETTGVEVQVFRFPGGSVNAYNAGFYQELIAEMLRRGFTYYDWNVNGEETARSTAESVRQAVVSGVEEQSRSIVLMHDGAGRSATAKALPGILEDLLGKGYCLEPITPEVEPIWFSYNTDV